MKLLYNARITINFKINCNGCKSIYELMVLDLQHTEDLQYYVVKTFNCEVCGTSNVGIKVPKSCLTPQEQVLVNNNC